MVESWSKPPENWYRARQTPAQLENAQLWDAQLQQPSSEQIDDLTLHDVVCYVEAGRPEVGDIDRLASLPVATSGLEADLRLTGQLIEPNLASDRARECLARASLDFGLADDRASSLLISVLDLRAALRKSRHHGFPAIRSTLQLTVRDISKLTRLSISVLEKPNRNPHRPLPVGRGKRGAFLYSFEDAKVWISLDYPDHFSIFPQSESEAKSRLSDAN